MVKSQSITKDSLSNQACVIIKDRILRGETPPGTRLVVDKLATQLGISRTPVREGLSKLVSTGLVSYDGKSYMVSAYTSKDVRELFSLRRALEVLAIRETTKNVPLERLDRFRARFDRTAARLRDEEDIQHLLVPFDKTFHHFIYDNCMNDRLRKILYEIHEKVLLIHKWGHLMKNVKRIEAASIDEYAQFLEFMYARDDEHAARLMEEHLTAGETTALVLLRL